MVVLITGASAGIGQAVAERLSARGARLVLAARRLKRLEDLNDAMSRRHLVIRADVACQEDCELLVARTIEHFGRIDTLVCNAGYGIYRPLQGVSPAAMRDIFATNLFGTTDLIHAALPHMLRQEPRDGWRGQIMIVSSVVARRAVPYMGAYSATKAAQLSIAEALRVELAPQKLAVTSVHPIQTKTEFGRVAVREGGLRIAPAPMAQSVDIVAKRMIDAMALPRREVWPHRSSRWAFGLSTLLPGTFDAIMSRYLRRVKQLNGHECDAAAAGQVRQDG